MTGLMGRTVAPAYLVVLFQCPGSSGPAAEDIALRSGILAWPTAKMMSINVSARAQCQSDAAAMPGRAMASMICPIRTARSLLHESASRPGSRFPVTLAIP
jgi:hypothetical protein